MDSVGCGLTSYSIAITQGGSSDFSLDSNVGSLSIQAFSLSYKFTVTACGGGKTIASYCVTSNTVDLIVESCSNYVL